MRGGANKNALPDGLELEIVYNDHFRGVYTDDFKLDHDNLDSVKQESEDILSKLTAFVEKTGTLDGVPITVNTNIDNTSYEKLIHGIKEEYDVCNGKIDKGKLLTYFIDNGKKSMAAMLKHNGDIIGICVFYFTHSPAKRRFGNKINNTKLFIRVDWLCGSKYKGVGSILVNLLKKIKEEFNLVSIHLISYDSAVPFYEKMGMTYIGDSWAGTKIMELA